ncbi:MAG: SUMF1/EgtB/PvdO family nonheme iron enzyme [Xanthobacteraceae bacterium]
MRLVAAFACAMTLICVGVLPSKAEKRVALVIGNSAYRNGSALPNTPNDANDIAASFARLGFSVTKVLDAGFNDMRRALLQFGREARGSEMAIVFFAGHGMEIGGENWLIPVDAELMSDTDAENEAVSLRTVMLQVSGASSLGLVILDACRNNPFAAKMQRTVRTRAVDRGLVRTEPTDNVLVAYAAKDGTTANDGTGRNSPFTAALLNNLEVPGVEISFLFRKVRDEVMMSTKREQQPFVYGSLSGQAIYLKEGSQPPQMAAVAPPVVPANPCGASAQTVSLTSRSAQPLSATEECLLKPKDVFKECDKCPEMVVVPAGSFMMGSPTSEVERDASNRDELPQHSVAISKPFAVGRFAVTFDEWDACVVDGGCDRWKPCVANGGCNVYKPSDEGWGRGRRPVINVSWDDAKGYVAWLSRKTGKTYRLLSEAEREYVARAGTSTPFWWGSSISTSQANYDGTSTYGGGSKGEYRKQTLPVDSFQPNPWGLYQVHGNVWEWVEDCYDSTYPGGSFRSRIPSDGSALVAGVSVSGFCDFHVARGGSWSARAGDLRAARRNGVRSSTMSENRTSVVGFRLARTLTP